MTHPCMPLANRLVSVLVAGESAIIARRFQCGQVDRTGGWRLANVRQPHATIEAVESWQVGKLATA